mmetsp:Transcript_45139/g.98124  ORF Transcript_45139/g.98124 Transcript_45139/m.98124 type:complete len:316 (+) Transcript_45139:54-1001(+)
MSGAVSNAAMSKATDSLQAECDAVSVVPLFDVVLAAAEHGKALGDSVLHGAADRVLHHLGLEPCILHAIIRGAHCEAPRCLATLVHGSCQLEFVVHLVGPAEGEGAEVRLGHRCGKEGAGRVANTEVWSEQAGHPELRPEGQSPHGFGHLASELLRQSGLRLKLHHSLGQACEGETSHQAVCTHQVRPRLEFEVVHAVNSLIGAGFEFELARLVHLKLVDGKASNAQGLRKAPADRLDHALVAILRRPQVQCGRRAGAIEARLLLGLQLEACDAVVIVENLRRKLRDICEFDWCHRPKCDREQYQKHSQGPLRAT